MSTEKARWAKLAGLPKTTDKQQLDENFIGHQMVGNIFDREKEKYEDAFEHFLSERYEKEENLEEGPKLKVKEIPTGPGKPRIPLKRKEIPTREEIDEKLATQSNPNLDALKFSILRAIPNFTNKEELGEYILGLIDEIDDDLFDMEIEVDLFDKR